MTIKPGLDIASFDTSVRPQDDLFRHTNGKWIDEVEIPADQAIYGSFMILRDLSEERVRVQVGLPMTQLLRQRTFSNLRPRSRSTTGASLRLAMQKRPTT